ncbi:ABC transporter ATP-binding protein [Vibrio sp. WJH972]
MECSTSPTLTVDNLSVKFGQSTVVENLDFSVMSGRTLAIVGESGSGKSVTSQSIMRLADISGATYSSGRILFNSDNGTSDLLSLSQDDMRHIRGNDIAMIFQEPMTSLNPVYTIGDQISEVIQLHEGKSKAEALKDSQRLLEMVRLPNANQMLTRYPHQLSGGMRQRVMIAMALACRPKLLIADEPTTALDVTIQAQILAIISDLQKELDMAVIFITHDMGVVAEIADDVVVMWKGKKVEEGSVQSIFNNPQHPYTQTLLAAVPRLGEMTGEQYPKRFQVAVMDGDTPKIIGEEQIQNTANYDVDPLLTVEDIAVRFDINRHFFKGVTHRIHAVEKVNFSIYPGETLALVGESGSGKSTIGRSIQQLQALSEGDIYYKGRLMRHLTRARKKQLKQEIQYIFQDPFASLDPRKTVGFSIAEPIYTHKIMHRSSEVKKRVSELLERVGLSAEHASRYPHEFSGGQRQRICIARALACNPKLIIADEALSALDVTVQAQIINLLMELQAEQGIALLFISHDMAVVEKMSHRVAVLYLGQIAEIGSRQQVLETPQHPYTKKLLNAVPVADPNRARNHFQITGEIPSPVRKVGNEPEAHTYKQHQAGHFVAQDY